MESAQKVAGSANGAGEVDALADSEKADLAKAVADSQESASEYDLTRLANTVEGYAPKPNYIVKSALNMELIWCPPGSFIMGGETNAHLLFSLKGFISGNTKLLKRNMKKSWELIRVSLKEVGFPLKWSHGTTRSHFCEALTKKESVPNGWNFFLLRKPNGSMPVGQELQPIILGVMT